MSTTVADSTRIAMLAYPKFTALDLIGPHQVLASLPGVHVDVVAKTTEPVVSDRQISIIPAKSFSACEADYDILLVPGGVSTHLMVEDTETLKFLARIGDKAAYVTSVCTGSVILAAAELLKGYRATSHWAYREILADYGAIPSQARFVVDRNRVTGGGVTAGVDFGLHLAAILRGCDVAKMIQLIFEYDPKPPFDVGVPEKAAPEVLAAAVTRLEPLVAPVREAARRFAARHQ
ncbi:DJ-1/PfpI family protein [Cupriavidus consociatus]|uniref:DJ-1/PfpI family protein n=1 Tax=Cupriavidus consociatus TaxID=2821357 RepID=UPI001AE3C904|nr:MULTISPECIES: DJ-1/PfpI family protein [unclassified Cupriavidus]MBP0623103.1 DJ-1/PfpI family protein [Cupriavidus sp. LEh25]MDK2659794.1 DJ-1/PfpI family protein [Cupriavidus sp. LEh21]